MNGYKGIWFSLGQFTQYGDKYSGGLGTYTANHRPMAVYAPEVNKTFFVYGGTPAGDQRHLLLMASCYDHATHTVPRPTLVHDKGGVDDPHDNPSLSIGSDGTLYVFISGRSGHRPGLIFKSVRPYEVDRFEQLHVFNGMTYPQPFWSETKAEFQFFFTQYTNGRELYFATGPDAADWSPPVKLAGFGGHYQVASRHPGTGKLATFFNWHPDGNLDARTNIYYIESTDGGTTWHTAEGTPLELPLRHPRNPSLVEELLGQNLRMYTCDLAWDAEGHPLLLYVVSPSCRPGPAGAPREWRVSRWDGNRWHTSAITTSTHAYDMGSLYVEGDTWTVTAPTAPGPQQWGTGGEIEQWQTRDRGATWTLLRQVTRNSRFNHSYVRHPLPARDPFFAFWADGDPDQISESRLYFCNRDGTRVWRLPYDMPGDVAEPEPVS